MNCVGNFWLVISPTKDGLHMAVRVSTTTTYDLIHLGGDNFYQPVDRDAELLNSRFPYPYAPNCGVVYGGG